MAQHETPSPDVELVRLRRELAEARAEIDRLNGRWDRAIEAAATYGVDRANFLRLAGVQDASD